MPSLRHAAGPVSDYYSYCEKAIGIPPAGYNNLPGALVFCSTYRDATSLSSKILNDIVFIFLMEVRIFAKIFYIKIYYYRNHGFGKYHINENTVKEMKNLSSLIILIRILSSVLHKNESTINAWFWLNESNRAIFISGGR